MDQTIITIITFFVSAAIFTFIGFTLRKKIAESKLQSAENEAKRIIDLAAKEAENKKKEEIFKAKEEIMVARKDLDQEIKERRSEVQAQERRVVQKEENLENKVNQLEKKEQEIQYKDKEVENRGKVLDETINKQVEELERISKLSVEDAKKQLLSDVEKQITVEKAAIIRRLDEKAKETAEKNAKEMIGYAIQKCAADHTSETTVSIVSLPNDDMKGRIIGREGRNIKMLETLTGKIGRASCRERV